MPEDHLHRSHLSLIQLSTEAAAAIETIKTSVNTRVIQIFRTIGPTLDALEGSPDTYPNSVRLGDAVAEAHRMLQQRANHLDDVIRSALTREANAIGAVSTGGLPARLRSRLWAALHPLGLGFLFESTSNHLTEPVDSAGVAALPPESGTGRRIVVSNALQRIWLVEATRRGDVVVASFPISGSLDPRKDAPRHNRVLNHWHAAVGYDGVFLRSMVTFHRRPAASHAIGFQEIPRRPRPGRAASLRALGRADRRTGGMASRLIRNMLARNSTPVQDVRDLGRRMTNGGIRLDENAARRVARFVRKGTNVIVADDLRA